MNESSEAIQDLVSRTRSDLNCCAVCVTMLFNERQVILAQVSRGGLDDHPMVTPIDLSLCHHAAVSRVTLVIDDIIAHPVAIRSPALLKADERAYAGVPLFLGDTVWAVLSARQRWPRAWSDNDIRQLEGDAIQAAGWLVLDQPSPTPAVPIIPVRN